MLLFLSLLSLILYETYQISSYANYQQISMDLDSKTTCVYFEFHIGTILYINLLQRSTLNPSMSLRLTSPSGNFSQWEQQRRGRAKEHGVTENGDHEICIILERPLRVTLIVFVFDPIKYNQIIEDSFKSKELTENIAVRSIVRIGADFVQSDEGDRLGQ
ncbi:hypothetical protein RB195_007754 [Necator americanus]|uniref:GOLD domain-containing protein n=1 Tax=Necator americanus TaxID=51031 RepID=A0ABR1BYS5_NECAM